MLVLRNKKLHTYNRAFLLIAVISSIVIPLLHINWYNIKSVQSTTVITLLNVLNTGAGERTVARSSQSNVIIPQVLVTLYVLVSLAFLVLLVVRIGWIYRLKNKEKAIRMEGFNLIRTKSEKAPFSFLNNLFWNDEIAIDSDAGRLILNHELIHITQKHTLDKLFLQLTIIVCWINPFYWFIQKELSQLHEFLADEGAINDNDTEAFAVMLLQSHYSSAFSSIIQSFFYSSIKRRLIMLSNSNKTSFSRLRRFMVLPLLTATTLLFSFTAKNDALISRADKKIIMTLDAGHGGHDDGATSVQGIKEKDLNLKIVDKITRLAAEYNIDIVSTRNGDNYPTLNQRVEIAAAASSDIFISIHVNDHSKDNDKNDYEMYISRANPNFSGSRLLASSIAANLKPMGINMVLNDDKGLWVLKQSKTPAVLIECGDINNANEMDILSNDAKLEAFCRNILSGVVNYHNNAKN